MISSDQTHLLQLDEFAIALFVKLPASKVAFLQSLLETYEGLGTVRTLDVKNSLIAVITTTLQLATCEELLNSVKPIVSWSYAQELEDQTKQEYFGFMKTETTESTF